MKALLSLWDITKFLLLLLCLPLFFGLVSMVIWDLNTGITVSVFILGGLIDLLIIKKWTKR